MAHIVRVSLLAVTLALLAVPALSQDNTFGLTWEPGSRLLQAFAPLVDEAYSYGEREGYGLRPGLSLLGADLAPDGSAAVPIEFAGGSSYALFVCGDDGVGAALLALADLDTGDEIASAEAAAGAASVIEIEVAEDTVCHLSVSAAGNATEALVGVLILEKDRPALTPSSLGQACGMLCRTGQEADAQVPITWQDAEGQWCLFGGELAPGENFTFSGAVLGEGPFEFLARGDMAAKDLNIQVLDADGNLLGEDVAEDDCPVVVLDGPLSADVTVYSAGPEDDPPSFVVCATLRPS